MAPGWCSHSLFMLRGLLWLVCYTALRCRCSRAGRCCWAGFSRQCSGRAFYTRDWESLTRPCKRGLIGDGSWPHSLLSAWWLVSWWPGMNPFQRCNTSPSPCARGSKRLVSATRRTKEKQIYEIRIVLVLVLFLILVPGDEASHGRLHFICHGALALRRLQATRQTDRCRYRTQAAGGAGL